MCAVAQPGLWMFLSRTRFICLLLCEGEDIGFETSRSIQGASRDPARWLTALSNQLYGDQDPA